MRILHYVPNIMNVVEVGLMDYKTTMFMDMAESADVHLLTTCAEEKTLGKVIVHVYPFKRVYPMSCKRHYKEILSSISPNIVHIHACWDLCSYILFKECSKRNIPVILTFDRQLEPWHFSHHYWSVKLFKMLAFQRRMITAAGAIHVVNEQEYSDFLQLGLHPGVKSKRVLNERAVVIPAFNICGGVPSANMAKELIKLYEKVINSLPFEQMTDNEHFVEDILLQKGMSNGLLEFPADGNKLSAVNSLDDSSLLRLCLHSYDEGILDYIRIGLSALKRSAILPDVSKIDRYALRLENFVNDEDIANYGKISKLNSDKTLTGIERDVCIAIIGIVYKISHSCVHRSDFVKLFQLLRFNDYDEDLVKGKINELGLIKQVSRVIQILGERYGLTEGFMFTEPLNDNGTAKLRKKLYKLRIQ